MNRMVLLRSSLSVMVALVAVVVSACGAGAPSPPPVDAGISADRPCTTMGCVDGIRLELAPRAGWKPGAHSFEVTTPAGVTTCSGTLPLPACEAGRALTCQGPAGDVVVVESGCALPPDQHGFSTI